ncbi:hypothetical protein FRB99_007235 [Tulasnella sp. 403]|nr:hypothetical protein FRB99_007235 [Tulasnella sp. 403]
MSEPSDAELAAAVHEIVDAARRNGKLEKYTKGLIRDQLETQFDLPAGSLKPRKKVVNDAIEEAMTPEYEAAELAEEKGKENVTPPSKVESKRASKGKSSAKAPPPEHYQQDADETHADTPNGSPKVPKKRGKAASSSTKARRADRNTDVFLKMVGLDPGSRGADEQAASLLLNGLAGGKGEPNDAVSESEMSELIDEPPKKKVKKDKKDHGSKKGAEKSKEREKVKSEKKSRRKTVVDESDLSLLEDEPPKKAKKGKAQKTEKADKSLDKDEEMIKRLKSFVLACGIRKKWAKELEGLNSSQQVTRLRGILADLGMTGRLSLEKAAKIKEKRDFEQEMEDVLEFDAKINGPRASRSSSKKDKPKQSDEDESDKEASPGPSRGRKAQPPAQLLD